MISYPYNFKNTYIEGIDCQWHTLQIKQTKGEQYVKEVFEQVKKTKSK